MLNSSLIITRKVPQSQLLVDAVVALLNLLEYGEKKQSVQFQLLSFSTHFSVSPLNPTEHDCQNFEQLLQPTEISSDTYTEQGQ